MAGLAGVALLLVAYGLLQSGKIKSSQMVYPVLNFTGAGLILVSLIKDWNLSAFVIEVCWMAISLYGMLDILKNKGEKNVIARNRP